MINQKLDSATTTWHGGCKAPDRMGQPRNDNLTRTLRLTREMLAVADEGDRDRDDDSCGIVYGVLRDAAYRIRALAEEECGRHRRSGKWETADDQ